MTKLQSDLSFNRLILLQRIYLIIGIKFMILKYAKISFKIKLSKIKIFLFCNMLNTFFSIFLLLS